jgi:thiamine pyrophosphate-dependent acetolactate synthase large subunit-like protein
MGYGLRGAWRQNAFPDKEVVDTDGDGSVLMNIRNWPRR